MTFSRRRFISGLAGFIAGVTLTQNAIGNTEKLDEPIMVPKSDIPKSNKATTPFSSPQKPSLTDDFYKTCLETEENTPFLYDDKGFITVGQGVHIQEHTSSQGMMKYKLSRLDGKSFLIKDKKLRRMYQILSENIEQIKNFPAFKLIEDAPCKSTDTSKRLPNLFNWKDKNGIKHSETKYARQLFILNASDIKTLNTMACQKVIDSARQYHRFLDALPRGIQLTVCDLIYNCGFEGYKSGFPKFQTALKNYYKTKETKYIDDLIKESYSGSTRRHNLRKEWLSQTKTELYRTALLRRMRFVTTARG